MQKKLIHLLYVPTIYCNLGCTYCYLGELTDQKVLYEDEKRALPTLEYAIRKFQENDIVPFNVSLHGGEVTSLPKNVLSELFIFIKEYYRDHRKFLLENNFNKTNPHIKTNLYNFDAYYDTMVEHEVSISASVDIPLSLHNKYRVSKKGKSTLNKTLDNIALLAKYPHRKKMSGVMYDEHLDLVDEMISDIWKLHLDIGIDMNEFNFMFGFESNLNNQMLAKKEDQSSKAVYDHRQVQFYKRMKNEFLNTELERGLKTNWFDEFTPNYCTNSFNCGEKFFLLQSDGKIYSCVRGQGTEPFYYGDIFKDDVEIIMARAENNIQSVHRSLGLHKDCDECEYLSICHTGCAFVKHEQNNPKSYTCALQKEMYRDYPDLYPKLSEEEIKKGRNHYIVDMHPQLIEKDLKKVDHKRTVLPNDLYDSGNSLNELIDADDTLKILYGKEHVYLRLNGTLIGLESQILKSSRGIYTLSKNDQVEILISDVFLNTACKEVIRNTLLLQFLRDTPVVYGDEKRTKQEHILNHEIFSQQLEPGEIFGKKFFKADINSLLSLASQHFFEGVLNNFIITTGYLKRYHYSKQKENAFYHIQAINLPFHNFEFYWDGKQDESRVN